MSKGNARLSARVPARAAGRPSPRVAAILAFFALAGCAPDLGEAPHIQSPAAYADAKSFVAPKVDWPADAWWRAYGDPQLDQLIEEALAGSPDLEAAAARARGAAAMVQVAGANLWPTVAGSASVTETEQSTNQGMSALSESALPHGWHTPGQIAAGFDYELDFFGKNRATLAAATSEADAAAAEQAEARLQISAAVAETYANLGQLFADQRAARDAVRVRQESAELVESRSKSNLENEGAVSLARGQLHAAELESDALDRQIALTRDQLAALLGKGPDRGLAIVPPAVEKTRSLGLPAKLSVDFIGRRPDIVAARLSAEAAASRIEVANANFYPNVDLTGSFGYQSFDLKYLLQHQSQMGQLGPAVHLPIFDYGRNEGVYRGARADYDAAVAVYDRTLANALRDVADAYATRRGVAVEIKDARAALAESENGYRVIKQRYDAGLSRYTDVLTAENALLAQRRAVADLQAQAFAADVVMARALGGGYAAKS
jgi:NodT family efflux transporter outer membrane factor (OMF) lipoprotein